MEEGDDEVDLSYLSKYTFGYMRRFAFGVLRMKPQEFGEMLVAHFFDAMGGYNEQRAEDIKAYVSWLRIATYLATVKKEDKLTVREFWKLPWDDETETEVIVTKEEFDKQIEQASDFFARVGLMSK